MLTDEIKKSILASNFTQGQKLPSIRKLSQQLKISAGSVGKVFKQLEKEGYIKGYPGKGFYWGSFIEPKNISVLSSGDFLEKKFLTDMENGVLSAFSQFPTLKELSIRYNTSLYHIRKFIYSKIDQGILKKNGSKISFNEEKEVLPHSYILFIHRSNEDGQFLIDSDRELEVFRTLTKLTEEQKISVHFVGYHESSLKLVTPKGAPFTPCNDSHCLGAFISTWLVVDTEKLFSFFAKTDYPISVWWEHSESAYPKNTKSKKKWAFYNVAFSKDAGIIVGQYLKKKGITDINYLSPFHLSDWSKQRLEGLRQQGLQITPLTEEEHESPYHLTVWAKANGHTPRIYLRQVIEKLLQGYTPRPFVCANDWTAAVLIEIFKSRNEKRPYIIGFDNTKESYQYSFDSFAFNVEAMVKEALYHIISPTTYAILRKQIQTPLGTVIAKD